MSAGMAGKERPQGRADHAAKGRDQIARHLGKVIARLFPVVDQGVGHEIRDAGALVVLDQVGEAALVLARDAQVVQIVREERFEMEADDRRRIQAFEGPGAPQRGLHGGQAFDQAPGDIPQKRDRCRAPRR